jgi:hypothetical protein
VTSFGRIVVDRVVFVPRQVHDFTLTRGALSKTLCTPNELSAAR